MSIRGLSLSLSLFAICGLVKLGTCRHHATSLQPSTEMLSAVPGRLPSTSRVAVAPEIVC